MRRSQPRRAIFISTNAGEHARKRPLAMILKLAIDDRFADDEYSKLVIALSQPAASCTDRVHRS
jgi:hypothetical protein